MIHGENLTFFSIDFWIISLILTSISFDQHHELSQNSLLLNRCSSGAKLILKKVRNLFIGVRIVGLCLLHHLITLSNPDSGLADVRKVVPKRSQWKMIEQNETCDKTKRQAGITW